MPAAGGTLWVCFTIPDALPDDGPILSFLAPDEEAGLAQQLGERVLSGRAIAVEVRAQARAAYLDLVARIAATPIGGRTLRQALAGPAGTSRWWFLKTSEKDCEWPGDFYTTVIRLLCVKRAAEQCGADRVVVRGGPSDFARIVAGTDAGTGWRPAGWLVAAIARGVAARLRLAARYFRLARAFRRAPSRGGDRVDVLLHAQWDWSVRPTADGLLRDRYFTELPGELGRHGLRVAWLALCEPASRGAAAAAHPLDRIAAAVAGRGDVVPAERYLTSRRILAAALDFTCVARLLEFGRSPVFRSLFVVEGFDLFPAMWRQLVGLAAGSSVARLELVASATEAACRDVKPRALLTFLELFLQSRAIYAGARRLPEPPALWSTQHAAYGRDKLFGVVDPKRELRGEPDGLAVPAPDGLFVMGPLSRDMWIENGFAEETVVVTGGLRYQHVRLLPERPARPRPRRRLLLIGSLNVDADLDMCRAAAAAVSGLDAIDVAFRNHPAHQLTETAEFRPLRGLIASAGGDLSADLDAADLVLFNHSSVAEEALLRGTPVWQWLWAGVNESAFLDLPVVPRFTSVAALRESLAAFVRAPQRFRPSAQVRETVWRQCFGPEPERAATRIAERVAALVGVH